MKIYFSGSIRGGTHHKDRYLTLIKALQEAGHTVLTEHIFTDTTQLTDAEIFKRDVGWILEADCLIADVTTASHGVGFEVAWAVVTGVPVLCLAEGETSVSAMIQGCPAVEFKRYADTKYVIWLVNSWLDWLTDKGGAE